MLETEGVKYIGSKRLLIPYITDILSSLPSVESVLDGFAGTTRVGQALRKCGYTVYSNDLSTYSYAFGKCYVETSRESFDDSCLNDAITKLMSLSCVDGMLTKYYSGGSSSFRRGEKVVNDIMYWKKKNTLKADAIRAGIEEYRKNQHLYYTLLTSLMIALDRVDNTVGVQQAFLKNSWAKRADYDLSLSVPSIPYNCPVGVVSMSDTNELVKSLSVDLAYYDPPYTSHNYSSYYHIWDTIVINSLDEVSGITNRRKNVKKSKYNYANSAVKTFCELLTNTNSRYILISYNNEGIIPYESLIGMAKALGAVDVIEIDYRRNIMSQIGIHNTLGEVVGLPGSKRNTEYLILISR